MSERHKIGLLVGGFLLVVVVLLRQPARPEGNPLDDGREYDRVVIVGIDLSGSFLSMVTGPDAQGYRFLQRVLDRYMQGNGREKLILVQLSGNNRALIWDGTPQDLRKQFPTPDAFRQFLILRADNASSRLHDGVSESLDYLTGLPGITPKTKCVALFMTDMDENASAIGHEQRLQSALTTFGKRGGAVGYYFVDMPLVPKHKAMLRAAGVKNYVVSSNIEVSPPLPSFE